MVSDYVFANPLPQGEGDPEVSFSCTTTPPSVKILRTIYSGRDRTGDWQSHFSIQTTEEGHVIHWANSIDFYLTPDTIIAHLRDPSFRYLVEILLLGEILSLWLELQGIRTVHASAVSVAKGGIAFLSTNQSGKSALAAAMVQKGIPLLSDDLVPIENRNGRFLARPGYPAMRMWPDQASHFLGTYEDLEIIHPELSKRRVLVGPPHFGTFCSEEKPLKVIYVPQRQRSASAVIIEPVARKYALMELIRNSFSAGIVDAFGIQPQRMRFFTDLVKQVPMRRLKYPGGFHHLPLVIDAVLEDVES